MTIITCCDLAVISGGDGVTDKKAAKPMSTV